MAAVQLREELFREMNPMLDSEVMLRQMLVFVRGLFAQQQVETKPGTRIKYRVEAVSPLLEKWSGCVQFSDRERADDPRLNAILSK